MHKKSMASSPRYRSFIDERNQVLERLLQKSQLNISDLLRRTLTEVLKLISHRYDYLNAVPGNVQVVERDIDMLFLSLRDDIVKEYKVLRKRTLLFTMLSTTEAMSRALGKALHFRHDHYSAFLAQNKGSRTAGNEHSLKARIDYSLSRIKHNLKHALMLGTLSGDDRKDLIQRVYKSFPKQQTMPKRRALKRNVLHEADQRQIAQRLSVGFLNDEEWKDVVDAYKEDFVPTWRGPESEFDVEPNGPVYVKADGEEVTYAWEVERDMSHDFVQTVRDGTNDAAKAQGITDFIIIAVIDKNTCDSCCGNFGCMDFDGKTTTEVSAMTKGEFSTSPFHFNCRCDMAPMTDDLPETVHDAIGDFDSWLNS